MERDGKREKGGERGAEVSENDSRESGDRDGKRERGEGRKI